MTPPPADCQTCATPLKVNGRQYVAPMFPGLGEPPRLVCWACWFAEGPRRDGRLL